MREIKDLKKWQEYIMITYYALGRLSISKMQIISKLSYRLNTSEQNSSRFFSFYSETKTRFQILYDNTKSQE